MPPVKEREKRRGVAETGSARQEDKEQKTEKSKEKTNTTRSKARKLPHREEVNVEITGNALSHTNFIPTPES